LQISSEPTDVQRSVSVIIPAYNAAAFLPACLDSVLAQDVAGLEVIVVDDGSTDATRKVVADYGDSIRYYWQANSGGCSSPRNQGVRHAKGDYLAFFDADDVMCPGRLTAQLEMLRRDPSLGLVLTDYRNFDQTGDYLESHFATCPTLLATTELKLPSGSIRLEPVASNRLLIMENYASAFSALIRRTAWVDVGGFDEALRASEDFDLIYRIARFRPIGLLGFLGTRRRLHSSNMSNATLSILAWKVASRTKLLRSETERELRVQLRRSLAAFELMRARALYDAGHPGSQVAYARALRHDVAAALRQWRVLARTLPIVTNLRTRPDAS
jgi:glycosyltransferase involved in cell wall biosynthesis